MSVIVIGNDPSPVVLNETFRDMYVFNQIYHMERHSFPCPTRIFHLWNYLFADKVKTRHFYLKKRCPNSIFYLGTISDMRLLVGPIRNYTSLSLSTVQCFENFNEKKDGHPWTLGFFLLASLIRQSVHPHVYGFSHIAWNGHPVRCEKQAVAEWNRNKLLVYHAPQKKK